MSKCVIGIDNGMKGGIVCLDGFEKIILNIPMPVIGSKKKEYHIKHIKDILGQLSQTHKCICFLEKAQPQGNNGPKQAFKTGFGYGVLQGILSTLEIPFQIVAPKVWQKKVFEGLNTDDKKLASALFCQRKWPKESWKATERCTTIHDGMTDAACIAYYGAKK